MTSNEEDSADEKMTSNEEDSADEKMTSNEEDSANEEYKLTQKVLFVQFPTRPIDLDTIPQDGSEFIHKSRLEEKMTSNEEDNADEEYKLTQKALYVQFLTRPIDLDTIPQDGSEFIHKSRLEDANLPFHQQNGVPVKTPEENEQKLMRKKARKAAVEFSRYGLKLTSDKEIEYMRKIFPRKLEFPLSEPHFKRNWCQFCLGSKLCFEIYDEKYEEPDEEIEGHLPVLSIIVHFDQHTAFMVLKYLHEWFLSIGMEDSLGRWVYAVLACIKKPLDGKPKKFIKTFYTDCKKRLKDCDELERSRLYLISAIFEYYFCVNSDKIGPPLEHFFNLQF